MFHLLQADLDHLALPDHGPHQQEVGGEEQHLVPDTSLYGLRAEPALVYLNSQVSLTGGKPLVANKSFFSVLDV